MKVLIAQMKPYLGNVEKNLEKMISIIERAVEEGKELIVFPELCLTGYLLEELVYEVGIKEIPEKLLELSRKISIIFGAVENGEDMYTYNTAYYLEDGELKHKHRKVYLPTYGMFYEGRYFKAGDRFRAFNTKFGRVGMMICEDAWHQTSHFILAQDGANYIFVLTSSPARISGSELSISQNWESILRAAAVSNSVYVAMANRAGVEDGVSFWGGSMGFAPNGDLLKKGEFFQESEMELDLPIGAVRRSRNLSPIGKNENIDLILKELKRIDSRRA